MVMWCVQPGVSHHGDVVCITWRESPWRCCAYNLALLTASMPDSCMPMLMTTTERTCQRTVGSSRRRHTDTVCTDDRERCSSCISSISSWMLHLARYHFRAAEGAHRTPQQSVKETHPPFNRVCVCCGAHACQM